MARLVVGAVILEGRSQSEVAREYGVSRQWSERPGRPLPPRTTARWPSSLARGGPSSPRRTPAPPKNGSWRSARHSTGPGTKPAPPRSRSTSSRNSARHRACQRSGGSSMTAGSSPAAAQAATVILGHRFSRPAQRALAGRHHAQRLADHTEVEICNQLDDHSRMCVGRRRARVQRASPRRGGRQSRCQARISGQLPHRQQGGVQRRPARR